MKHTLLACLLCFLAVIKVLADVLGFESLSAAASVTNAAPAMKVFTAHKGYETYSSTFQITSSHVDGQIASTELNPENYAGLQGPYNRRTVYGALIAYGPILFSNPKTKKMWNVMSFRSFCGETNVLSELGFTNQSGIKNVIIDYVGQVKSEDKYPNQLRISCD